MIKEDYVNFETANLLKEKGFDELCYACYDYFESGVTLYKGWTFEYKGYPVHNSLYRIKCPTLQMAMKWLREVHGIHINVFRYPAAFLGDNNEQHKPWWFQYTLLKPIKEIDIDSRMTNDELESAEEAMDYAIKYCLENLI